MLLFYDEVASGRASGVKKNMLCKFARRGDPCKREQPKKTTSKGLIAEEYLLENLDLKVD